MHPPIVPVDALVVRSDTDALRRTFRRILTLHVSLTVLLLVATGVIASIDLPGVRYFAWAFLVMLGGQVFQIATQCYHWGSRLAVTRPLVVDPRGITVHGQQGTATLPWPAISGIRITTVLGSRRLTIAVHPQAVPGTHGLDVDPESWARYRKRGLAIGEVGLVPGFETIVPAIQHFSAGRVSVS